AAPEPHAHRTTSPWHTRAVRATGASGGSPPGTANAREPRAWAPSELATWSVRRAGIVQAAWVCPHRPGSRADSGAQHDLPDLARHLPGTRCGADIARWRRAGLHPVHGVRGAGHHRAAAHRAAGLRRPAPRRHGLPALPCLASGAAGRTFAVPCSPTRSRQPAQAVRNGLPDQPVEPQGRGAVSVVAAAIHQPRPRQRAAAIADSGYHANGDQPDRERADRADGRLDRPLPRRPSVLAERAALADGHGTGGTGRGHGRTVASVRPTERGAEAPRFIWPSGRPPSISLQCYASCASAALKVALGRIASLARCRSGW